MSSRLVMCFGRAIRKRLLSQFVSNFVDRQRLAEIVALNLVALMRSQERHLRLVFDAFGNHLEIQTFRHADDGGCDRRIVSIDGDIPDKASGQF